MPGRMCIIVVALCVIGSLVFAVSGRAQVESTFTATPPNIDGVFDAMAWNAAGSYALDSSAVAYFLNDTDTLYVLFDVTADTVADDGPTPPMDSYHILFDVGTVGSGDVGVDLYYSICPPGSLVGRFFYLTMDPCVYGECSTTAAEVARGFGSSPASGTSHRIWEFAIPFSEIEAQAGEALRIGLGVSSPTPQLSAEIPLKWCDMANYLTLRLGAAGTVPALGRWGLGLLALLVAGFGVVVARRIF